MKNLLFVLMILSSWTLADLIDIKTGNGYREDLRRVDGVFKSRHQSRFPYVCYDKRIRVVSSGTYYLKYEGCTRVNVSCTSTGRAHFGRYPNDYKAYKALRRCRSARPKFVD